jgi:transposase InsO family protein
VDKARYLVEAHLLEGRSVSELAAAHGVHRSWIYKLLARYKAGGYGALERSSRAPHSSPNRTPAETVAAILFLREQLSAEGHDCGAQTIAHHLARQSDRVPSVSTIWRVLKREGLVSPQPQKRPRSSLIRFEAELPNETWQADVTHWPLAGAGHAEILNMLDDHSRLFLASRAFPTVKAADVVDVFRMAIALHGAPASLLTDNGAVFSATPRGGKVLLQIELERLGIEAKNSRPYHPQTCGKVERLHQTLKRYLANQAPQRRSPTCKSNWTASPATTTRPGLTGRWAGALPCRPMGPGSRPGHPAHRIPIPTSASATTRSTPRERSPCATTQSSITSASAAPTKASRSSSSSPTGTSGSSTSAQAS